MATPKIYESEYRFCLILWEHQPIRSKELVRLCEEILGWKSTTTYTVIKRLSERGVVKNENSVVTALISKGEFEGMQSEQFVAETFKGSLPAFLTAFSARKKLSDAEIDEIQKVIDSMRG